MKKEEWYKEQTELMCYCCGKLISKLDFYTDESRLTGYRPYCKKCDNQKRVERERNRKGEQNG